MPLTLRRGTSNYAYAVARVQAKRSKLIPTSEYDKVLKMEVPEITRYIEDSAYKAEVDELAGRFTGLDLLEAALTVNEERTYDSIRSMVGGSGGAILTRFLDRSHHEDLKTVLRGKAAGAKRDELLRELVLENQAAYDTFAPLLADDVKGVPDVIAALDAQGGHAREWAKLLSKVPAGSPLSRYDDVLDKAYYDNLLSSLESSGETGVDQVLEFVRNEVDVVNLLNAARWVAAGETGDFTPFVVPGGKSLKLAQVAALSKAKGLAEFGEMAAETKRFASAKPAIEAAAKAGRLAPLQAALWRAHLAEMDRLAHTHPLSLIPILVFLVRKHREVATLRAVARGKAAGLSENRLKELIL